MTPYVRKKYWNEPEMSWWEARTSSRSCADSHHRRRLHPQHVALDDRQKGALTTYYPEEKRWTTRRGNRGKHVLTQRVDGRPQCIACNMCATVCPAKVIEIEAAFDPADAVHPKYPARFEIDYSRCIFCGLCVEACPEDAIRMVEDVPHLPSADRQTMWLGKEELLTWRPQSDVAKHYPARRRRPSLMRVAARQPRDAAAGAVRRLCAGRRRAGAGAARAYARGDGADLDDGVLGGVYGLLGVHFIAAFQVLIYVGAVMVFMVYVIMLLDPRDSAVRRRFSGLLVPGVLACGLFIFALAGLVWETGRRSEARSRRRRLHAGAVLGGVPQRVLA